MTEPQGGADPSVFTTEARRDGDDWVIDGEKWFASNARYAAFVIVMAVTDKSLGAHGGMSMFIVPTDTPGLLIERNVGIADDPAATHAYLKFNQVRVPSSSMLANRDKRLWWLRFGSAAGAFTTPCGS